MRQAEVLTRQGRGCGGEQGKGAEDWREIAERTLLAEAARRGLGTPYDVEADSEGLAAALIAALTRWRVEAASGTAAGAASRGIVLPDAPAADLLCARWLRCPACALAGGRYIIALADGRVLALERDLTYACPSGEALAETTALCAACCETAPVADFRRG